MRQREKLAGATQLRSTRTNRSLYANTKDLIQSRRIYIRAASLSLVSFLHLSVMSQGRLISYINIYNLLAGRQYIISFSLQFCVWLEFSSLEVKYDIFTYRDEETWQKKPD